MLEAEGQTRASRRTLQAAFQREAKTRMRKALDAVKAERRRISKMKALSAPKLKALCRGRRERARARARAIKAEHKEAGKREADAILAAARGACDASRVRELKREGRFLAALELEAHRARERYLSEKLGSALLRQERKGPADRAESDDEVRHNIAPELVPVFDRVKRKIKASKGISRTEAFEHWVHDNAQEVASELAESADRDVAQWTQEMDRKAKTLRAMLKKKRVSQADLDKLGIGCPDVEALGLSCSSPEDVQAAFEALEAPSQPDEATPF